MGIVPTEKHKPLTNMKDYVWLFFGEPKVGKTTLANQFKDALFLATEPGTAAMEAAEMKINSWSDFRNAIKALRKEEHKWDTLVVDTIDNLYEFLVDDVCSENKWTDLSDVGFGKGYKIARRKLTNAIAAMRQLDMTIVFISHERREIEVDDNGKRTGTVTLTSALPGSARKVLHGAVDFILRVELGDGTERHIRTAPHKNSNEHVECGARGAVNRPLPELLDLNYKALEAAFNASFKANDQPTTNQEGTLT